MIETEESVLASNERDRRTARIMLRILKEGAGNDTFENEEAAKKITSSAFEARFMGLATHWSNDMIDLCLAALELKRPEGAEPFNSLTHDAWYKWFCETVDNLPIDLIE